MCQESFGKEAEKAKEYARATDNPPFIWGMVF